jgi:hypothetical protein
MVFVLQRVMEVVLSFILYHSALLLFLKLNLKLLPVRMVHQTLLVFVRVKAHLQFLLLFWGLQVVHKFILFRMLLRDQVWDQVHVVSELDV